MSDGTYSKINAMLVISMLASGEVSRLQQPIRLPLNDREQHKRDEELGGTASSRNLKLRKQGTHMEAMLIDENTETMKAGIAFHNAVPVDVLAYVNTLADRLTDKVADDLMYRSFIFLDTLNFHVNRWSAQVHESIHATGEHSLDSSHQVSTMYQADVDNITLGNPGHDITCLRRGQRNLLSCHSLPHANPGEHRSPWITHEGQEKWTGENCRERTGADGGRGRARCRATLTRSVKPASLLTVKAARRADLQKTMASVRPADAPPATEAQCTIALIKNIVGTGVLTLPAGVARLSAGGCTPSEALLLAVFLNVAFGTINAWSFLLIGEACAKTKEPSYVGAWQRTLGSSTAFVPALASLLLTFIGGVSCLTVIADTATDLLAVATKIEYVELPRSLILSSTSAGLLLPLCLLPSLAPLGTASLAGVLGVFITGVAMLTRVIDGAYAEGGAFVANAFWAPAFGSFATATWDANALTTLHVPDVGNLCFFVSLLSNAFLAHYNAPAVYSELAPPEPVIVVNNATFGTRLKTIWQRLQRAELEEEANFKAFIESTLMPALSLSAASPDRLKEADESNGLAPFRRVVLSSYVVSLLLFLLVACAGYCTFGDASQPNVILNYASEDPLAVVMRVGIGLCVLFEFPLLERPFRLTVLELLGVEAEPGSALASASAVTSVALLTFIALLGVPLDIFSALSGSTGGALLIYVAPALMSLRLLEDSTGDSRNTQSVPQKLLLSGLVATGLALGCVGTAESLGLTG